jgi:hypothetical protein
VKSHVEVFPLSSVAVQVTVLVPFFARGEDGHLEQTGGPRERPQFSAYQDGKPDGVEVGKSPRGKLDGSGDTSPEAAAPRSEMTGSSGTPETIGTKTATPVQSSAALANQSSDETASDGLSKSKSGPTAAGPGDPRRNEMPVVQETPSVATTTLDESSERSCAGSSRADEHHADG